MKIKYYFKLIIALIAINIICNTSVNGQKITIGKEQSLPAIAVTTQKFIKSNDKNIYAIGYNQVNKIYLQKFDSKMNLVSSQGLKIKLNKKRRIYIDMVHYNGVSTLITYFFSRKDRKSYLYFEEYDLDKNEAISEPKVVILTENERKKAAEYNLFYPLEIDYSPDKSKIAIIYRFPDNKIDDDRMLVAVFNNQFEQLWKVEKEVEVRNGTKEIYKASLTNIGDFYFAHKVKILDNRGRKTIGYKFSLEVWTNNGEKINSIELKLKDKEVLSAQVIEIDGIAKVVGNYGSKESEGRVEGFYIGDLTDKEFSEVLTYQFELKDFEELIPEKIFKEFEETKENYKIRNLRISEIIENTDNSFTLLCEQLGTSSTSYGTGIDKTSREYKVYRNIIVFNFSEGFSKNWMDIIQKKGISISNNKFNSFIYKKTDDKLLLLYPGNGKVMDRTKTRRIERIGSSRKDHNVYLTTFDKNGTRKDMKSDKTFSQAELNLVSNVSIVNKQNELFFTIFNSGKKMYVGKLKIE